MAVHGAHGGHGAHSLLPFHSHATSSCTDEDSLVIIGRSAVASFYCAHKPKLVCLQVEDLTEDLRVTSGSLKSAKQDVAEVRMHGPCTRLAWLCAGIVGR